MSLHGHLWTVGPRFFPSRRMPPTPGARPWSVGIDDPATGRIRLTGRWRPGRDPRSAVIVIHGLSGSCESPYSRSTDLAAGRAGLGCLRPNLRGSDRQGADFYHAGLTSDLRAAIASSDLEEAENLYLLGFSLGGHLALRAATERIDPRVKAVVAVCSPLELAPVADAMDRPAGWPYRAFVLRGLKEIYRAVARRREVTVAPREVSRIRRIREWDDVVVAPRFGFEDSSDYYRRASVGPRLEKLGVRSLLVAAENDPMVPAETIRASLADRRPPLEVFWANRGGHVGFPPGFDLGHGGPPGLEAQLLSWLAAG